MDPSSPSAGPKPTSGATRFNFEHKVFSVPGTIFRKDRSNGRVAMHMLLGGSYASLDLSQLMHNFHIAAGSPDAAMLKVVEQALDHVREIRPGDSIPNEILDGSASWTLDPKHLELARDRLLIQLAAWGAGVNSTIDPNIDVLALMKRPDTKMKIDEALIKATTELGMGIDGKHQITIMVEKLAAELSYIEALRDKIRAYFAIRAKVRKLRHIYLRVRDIGESAERIIRLIGPPLDKVTSQFKDVDARTGQVLAALRQLPETIEFIRQNRDRMRQFVLLWDDLDKEWAGVLLEQDPATEELIKQTYRFAATHYLTAQGWA